MASRAEHPPAGVILIAGGSNHYRSLATPWARHRRWLGFQAVRAAARALGYFPGDKIGFGGRQPLNLILDWTHEGLTGQYKTLGDAGVADDLNASLERLARPVLIVSLAGDLMVPRSSADALAAKLKRAVVTQLELQASDDKLKAFDHFKWVRRPEIVIEPMHAWMTELGSPLPIRPRGTSATRPRGDVT